MKQMNVLIIGAGAAGLMAAKELANAGVKVTILEARERSGGRIHTVQPEIFESPIEAGAEFIHGDGQNTISLLKEANIPFHKTEGSMWQYRNGKLTEAENFVEDWELLIKKLKEVREDISVKEFLDKYFGTPDHEGLRRSVTGFVEGYDAADSSHASVFAFREELESQSEEDQYRVDGGYTRMIDYMEKTCQEAGCTIHHNQIVATVNWKPGQVEVLTPNKKYHAEKLIVTVPIGILGLKDGEAGSIRFSPSLNDKQAAIESLGYGPVLKIILQFQPEFWKSKLFAGRKKEASFIFSEELIPTWWTQYPVSKSSLTGWLGGPKASELNANNKAQLFNIALASLGNIFSMSAEELEEQVLAWSIFKWLDDPFAKGAYSYHTVGSKEARAILRYPVSDTIYFAGEGIHEGSTIGTVEAALTSGKETAWLISKFEN